MVKKNQELPFYDDLDLSLIEAFQLLAKGASDRRSAAHTPVVATLDGEGKPSQRVMILRNCDQPNRILRFHTDSRSTKVGLIELNNAATVLVYDPQSKIQLRLSGHAHVASDGEEVDAAWENSTLFARRCYMAKAGPGEVSSVPTSGLPVWIEGLQPDEDQIAITRPRFALLLFEFDRLEWLYLANNGHRRAVWLWNETQQAWLGNWLVP